METRCAAGSLERNFMVSRFSIFVVLVIGFWGTLVADEVILTDGIRLIGKVQGMEGGKLRLSTDYAGDIQIDASKIQGITTDGSLKALVGDGEASGAMVHDAETGQEIDGVAVDLSQVSAIWAPGDRHPTDPKWTTDVQLGLNGKTGNTERAGFLGRADVHRDTDHNRMLWYGQTRYDEQNKLRTVNEILGGYDIEENLDGKRYWWGNLGLEHDEFEALSFRGTATVGLGRFWIREPGHELKTRFGGGYEHERFFGGNIEDAIVAALGVDYLVEIAPWLLFTHSTDYYSALDDPGEDYRIVSETAAEIPLDSDKAWRLRVGMQNSYNALPPMGIERLDTYFFLNLVWSWSN